MNRKAAWKNRMQVRAVHNARYVLRQCGIEVFFEASEIEFYLPFLYEQNWAHKMTKIIMLKEGRCTQWCVPSLWSFFVFCPYYILGSSKCCILFGPYKLLIVTALKQLKTQLWLLDRPQSRAPMGRWPGSLGPETAVATCYCHHQCPGWRQPKGLCEAQERWGLGGTRILAHVLLLFLFTH